MSKKPNVLDRLTDSSKYTGSHKERFNDDGTGKGKAGRVDNTAPKDLSEMVNSKLQIASSQPAEEKKVEPKKKEGPSIFDKLTDTKLYTGAHKQRFDEEGKGKGKAGRVDNTGPKNLANMVDSKNKVNNEEEEVKTAPKEVKKKEGPSIFDKLTDPKQYTGSHKERFDEDGKGKGKAGRVDNTAPKDLSSMVDSKSKVTSAPEESKVIKEEKKKDGPSIFDKLTDPKQYTGAHKQRFDEEGKGKGKAGRDVAYDPKNLNNLVKKK
jgi:hypothetical protein